MLTIFCCHKPSPSTRRIVSRHAGYRKYPSILEPACHSE
jgi:hypothetical protein